MVQITAFGVWIDVEGKEYFLDRARFPWFLGATVEQICKIEKDRSGNLHWPSLDVDLEIESLGNPEKYPLAYH